MPSEQSTDGPARVTQRRSYWLGFASALLLLLVFAIVARVSEWAAGQPLPGVLIEVATTPLFSVVDVAGGVFAAFFVWLVVYMAAFGPRVSP